MQKVLFTGIQPSNILHIGNYLGMLKEYIRLQNINTYKNYFMIADLHALTANTNIEESRLNLLENSLSTVALLLACGIDYKKTIVFRQSEVSPHTELMWILCNLTSSSMLNRMIQYKTKKKDSVDTPNQGIYNYPVLMAADIILYKSNYVPIGNDQMQHLELCRDLIKRINLFSQIEFFLPIPENILGASPRIKSLIDGNRKMSKSDKSKNSCIFLTDDNSLIEKKIERAKTDSISQIYYDPARKEISNLLLIYASLVNEDVEHLKTVLHNDNAYSFKQKLIKELCNQITPIRKSYNEILKDKNLIKRILNEGKINASKAANQTLDDIKKIFYLI